MQQLPVGKQGYFAQSRWHDRLATFDTAQLCVFLSEKDNTNMPYRHKLYVEEVQLWPRYHTQFIVDEPNSREAILTLRVRGVALPVTTEDRARVRRCSRFGSIGTVPCGAARKDAGSSVTSSAFTSSIHDEESGAHPGYDQQNGGAASTPPSPPSSHIKKGKRDEWMLRCCTADDLEELVAAFETLRPAPVLARTRDGVVHSTVAPGLCGARIVGDLSRVKSALKQVNAGDWLGAEGI